MLVISFLLKQLWSLHRTRWQLIILPVALGGFLFLSYLQGSMMFWHHIEWEGAIEDVGTLSEKLPKDSILLFRYSPSGLRLGLPLLYVYDHNLFLIHRGYENNARLRTLIQQWKEQGQSVYWLENDEHPSIDSYGPVTYIDEMAISWPTVPHTREQLPDKITRFSPTIRIFDVEGTTYTFPVNSNANLGNRVMLLGYEVEDTAVAQGETIHLTLHWQALQSMGTNYTAFTHLLDDDLKFGGQKDRQPTKPTKEWVDGEIVHDTVTIPVDDDAKLGTYRLQVGLYDLSTMERLPVLSDQGDIIDDKVILGSIEVTGSATMGIEEN
jgi:hypothetical protein